MRRFYLFLLLTAFLLSGCSDLATLLVSPEEDPFAENYVAATPEVTYPEELSTVARMVARGEMVVGVRYDLEPFSYITSDSELAGLEIDLARELALRWLGDAEAVRFRQVRSDSAYQHLVDGTVDIVLAGVTHTQEGEALADFSPAYFMNGLAMLTFPDTGIQSVGDLQNHRVGVVEWTGSESKLEAAVPLSTTFVPYDDFFAVVEALRVREIDVYVDMRHRLERARRMVSGANIVGQLNWEPVSLVYRQDDPFFANLVALTFQDMALDGTRDALYGRWLSAAAAPNMVFLPDDIATSQISATPQERSSLDIIERIRGRGTLAVGYFVDRWPYSSDRADGVSTGFEVRLMERVAERWLGSRQSVTFVPFPEADALAALDRGEVDILIGNWVHTRELEARFDFSISIIDDGIGIFSQANNAFDSFAALSGQPVAVLAGSSAQAALPALSQAAGVGVSSQQYPDLDAAFAALQLGEVTAIISERRALLKILYNESGYYLTDARYNYRPVAYVISQGDSDFRDLLNLTLETLYIDGSYGELYGLWFDDPVPAIEVWPGSPAIPLVISVSE